MLQYLIKFSISLSVLYIFYKLVLRPLTFYQWNRFYLLSYSFLSFLIPFININPWVDKKVAKDNTLINIIPSIGNYSSVADNQVGVNITPGKASLLQRLTATDWILLLFCVGAIIMLLRLLLQYISLRRIRRSAVLLHENAGIQLYEVAVPVGPFSFGNAIYINRQLHSEDELQRIIQHEFVHVKQKHTIDLMLGEFLCVVNWFNPFAWFIRQAIRQNLEFIVDNNVIKNGMDKKEYQYLLLKVVGKVQYSIASNFNMSNLKKRIAMMNKMKSARLHLTKFLFVLPLMAVMLLAFRNKSNHRLEKGSLLNTEVYSSVAGMGEINSPANMVGTDTVPSPGSPVISPADEFNEKGYRVTVADNEGERIVLVKDKANKIVKAMTLEEWKKDRESNESMYGELLPLPAQQPGLPANVDKIEVYSNTDKKTGRQQNQATVILIDGTKEVYNLYDKNEKQRFIKKYGELVKPIAPVPPVPGAPSIDPISPVPQKADVSEFAKPGTPVPPIKIKAVYNSNDSTRPLVIIDGVVKEKEFDLNSLHSNDLESVMILKDNTATIKYGKIAKNGAIEITTKMNGLKQITFRKDTIPWKTGGEEGLKNPGYLINGKPATKKEVSNLKSNDIEKTEFSADNGKVGNPFDGTINIITKDAKDKKEASMFKEIKDDADKVSITGRLNNTVYIGIENVVKVTVKDIPFKKIVAKINNGLIEKKEDCFVIKPVYPGENAEVKIYEQQNDGLKEIATRTFRVGRLPDPYAILKRKEEIIVSADSISYSNNQLMIKGILKFDGKESFAEGNVTTCYFEGGIDKMGLIIYNGKEVTSIQAFATVKAKYRIQSLSAKDAIAKYGEKGKNGAIEIDYLGTLTDQINNGRAFANLKPVVEKDYLSPRYS